MKIIYQVGRDDGIEHSFSCCPEWCEMCGTPQA